MPSNYSLTVGVNTGTYNVEVGCGGGIRLVYPTPADYRHTAATGIHTFVVEAQNAHDAIHILQQYEDGQWRCGKYSWPNYPEPLKKKDEIAVMVGIGHCKKCGKEIGSGLAEGSQMGCYICNPPGGQRWLLPMVMSGVVYK